MIGGIYYVVFRQCKGIISFCILDNMQAKREFDS